MKVNIKENYKLFIGGEWKEASSGETLEVKNPATGEVISHIAQATEEDVDAAVKAAHAAFEGWSKTSVQERADIVWKIGDIIYNNLEELATIETMDNGKPIRETKGADLPLSADHFHYFAGALRAEEGSATMVDENTMNLILHEPIGVVGQIVPWNFPFLMAAWKLAPALAAGNTVVIKPSSSTSLTMLRLAELLQDVLPKGVLNVITGSGSKSGEYLQKHKGLDKLAFTGSTEVGREIAHSAAENLIPATLELGGKSANIIYDDADIEKAIEGVQLGILFNQGQVCSAGSRIFVQEGIYDSFVAKLKEAFEKVVVGDPLDEKTQLGAQINKSQHKKVLDYVEIGLKEGAKLLTGGKAYTENGCDKGVFMQPTLFVDVDNKMRIAQEEIFGPVGAIIKFKDMEDVVAMANDSVYGLGGGVWTKDIKRAIKTARGIRTGRIWINTYNTFPAGATFGGYKQSGIGRETHKVMLEHYSQMKNIIINLSDSKAGMY